MKKSWKLGRTTSISVPFALAKALRDLAEAIDESLGSQIKLMKEVEDVHTTSIPL